jgi:DNA repair protein RadC
MQRIRDKFAADRPREKIAQKGVKSLTDTELAMAIIGSGNAQADVVKISQRLVKILKAYNGQVTYDDLQKITGMGPARVAQILATFELASRYSEKSDRPILDSPEKVLPLLTDIRDKRQEHFVALTLDGANRLIKKRIVTIGTLTSSLVHPREVFAPAIEDRAAGVIVVHNHPSGSLQPSQADHEVTERLKNASELLGVNLIDHLIVTADDFHSIL